MTMEALIARAEITPADHAAVRAFLRSDDCPLSVKMVLGAKPDALLALLAGHRQRAEGVMKERCAAYMDARSEQLFAESANKSTGSMMRAIFAAEATAIRGIDAGGEGGAAL